MTAGIAQQSTIIVQLPWSEVFTIVGTVATVILGGVALWLAVVLYRLSSASQVSVEAAAQRIERSTSNLESLYDRLYADLFSITRDTVADMRSHFWPTESSTEAEVVAAREQDLLTSSIASVRAEMIADLQRVLAEAPAQGGAPDVDSLTALIDDAISKTRLAETTSRETVLRDLLLADARRLLSSRGYVRADELMLAASSRFTAQEIIEELGRMREAGIVSWDTPHLEQATIVVLRELGDG